MSEKFTDQQLNAWTGIDPMSQALPASTVSPMSEILTTRMKDLIGVSTARVLDNAKGVIVAFINKAKLNPKDSKDATLVVSPAFLTMLNPDISKLFDIVKDEDVAVITGKTTALLNYHEMWSEVQLAFSELFASRVLALKNTKTEHFFGCFALANRDFDAGKGYKIILEGLSARDSTEEIRDFFKSEKMHMLQVQRSDKSTYLEISWQLEH